MNSDKKKTRSFELFDSISNTTTSKVSELIKKIKGYEEEIEEVSDSRTENLGKALSNGDFQPVENDEVKEQLKKLQEEMDPDSQDN